MSNSMLLSDAIRIGCAFNGQTFTTLVDKDGNTCALGSALKGAGYVGLIEKDVQQPAYDYLSATFPYLHNEAAPRLTCDCHMYGESLKAKIWHLNDHHKVSREEVADFIEQWEIANGYKAATVKEINSETELALAY